MVGSRACPFGCGPHDRCELCDGPVDWSAERRRYFDAHGPAPHWCGEMAARHELVTRLRRAAAQSRPVEFRSPDLPGHTCDARCREPRAGNAAAPPPPGKPPSGGPTGQPAIYDIYRDEA